MRDRLYKKGGSRGFTIVELMIATTVLSVIILLVTTMIIGIGNLYYKGINQARVQDTVRSVSDEVQQQLLLSGVIPQEGSQTIGGVNISIYCLGSVRYSYIKGVQKDNPYPHILWRDSPNSGCNPNVAADLTNQAPSPSGVELIPPNSRITAFCIGAVDANGNCTAYSTTSPYPINFGIAYGSNDLLTLAGMDTKCNSNTGDRFCATASLATTVANRL